MRGAWQHAVFGSDPTFPAALFVAGDFFFHRRSTQNFGVAKLYQHRAFSMNGAAAGNAHRAKLVCGTVAAQCFGHGFKVFFWQQSAVWLR